MHYVRLNCLSAVTTHAAKAAAPTTLAEPLSKPLRLPACVVVQVLFTVVPREQKYRAKLVMDTVVQRLGDAIAAAAFQVLGGCAAYAREGL